MTCRRPFPGGSHPFAGIVAYSADKPIDPKYHGDTGGKEADRRGRRYRASQRGARSWHIQLWHDTVGKRISYDWATQTAVSSRFRTIRTPEQQQQSVSIYIRSAASMSDVEWHHSGGGWLKCAGAHRRTEKSSNPETSLHNTLTSRAATAVTWSPVDHVAGRRRSRVFLASKTRSRVDFMNFICFP